MDSIKMCIPKKLIKSFHPHPDIQDSNYHVITLMNGIYTDVWIEDDKYVTITNDEQLITYINAQTKDH
jgi:hypothetical protein